MKEQFFKIPVYCSCWPRQESSVSILTGHGWMTKELVSDPWKGKRFFSSPQPPNWLWAT
jgi:hypothetical protein